MARINHCLYQITLNMWVNTSQHKNSAYLTSFICAMQFDPNDFSVPQIDIDIWRTYMRDKNTILISSKCCLFSSAFYAFCIIIITSRIDGTVQHAFGISFICPPGNTIQSIVCGPSMYRPNFINEKYEIVAKAKEEKIRNSHAL